MKDELSAKMYFIKEMRRYKKFERFINEDKSILIYAFEISKDNYIVQFYNKNEPPRIEQYFGLNEAWESIKKEIDKHEVQF